MSAHLTMLQWVPYLAGFLRSLWPWSSQPKAVTSESPAVVQKNTASLTSTKAVPMIRTPWARSTPLLKLKVRPQKPPLFPGPHPLPPKSEDPVVPLTRENIDIMLNGLTPGVQRTKRESTYTTPFPILQSPRSQT